MGCFFTWERVEENLDRLKLPLLESEQNPSTEKFQVEVFPESQVALGRVTHESCLLDGV